MGLTDDTYTNYVWQEACRALREGKDYKAPSEREWMEIRFADLQRRVDKALAIPLKTSAELLYA